jgi:hypothetical protein
MIDLGIEQPWPLHVLDAVKHFKQGHLVEQPPILYAAVSAHAVWNHTKDQGEPSSGLDFIYLEPTDALPYGLISTQTCDLVEESPKPRQPWIQVVPVYDAGPMVRTDQHDLIRQHRIGHLIPLTGAMLPSGLWVADLRIEVPLEKSCLVGRQPIESFDTEDAYLKLAERLAARRTRPALAPPISRHIVQSLRDLLGKKKTLSTRDAVHEVRLYLSGSRVSPSAAQLLIITHEPASAGVLSVFNGWWEKAEQHLDTEGIALLNNRFETLQSLTAEEYLNSIPLDFVYLSPDA